MIQSGTLRSPLAAAGARHSTYSSCSHSARPAQPAASHALRGARRRHRVRVWAEAEGSRAGKEEKPGSGSGSSDSRPADPLAGFEEFWKTGGFPHYLYSQPTDSKFCHELDARVEPTCDPAPPFSKPSPPALAAPTYVSRHLNSTADYDPLWAQIRAEVLRDAASEPILSSYLYSCVLSHNSFERSLSFVLANRLSDATLLATQLTEIFTSILDSEPSIRMAARADLAATRHRDPACRTYADCLLFFKGYHSLQVYRIANALWRRDQRVMALTLQSRVSEVFAVDVHPAARIGSGILFDHGTGVVIGETAVVGDQVSILHGVTLGGTGKETGDRHPKIGRGVLLGAHCTILGNITIGEGALIASGSLVLKPVPPHALVAGSPAKVVGTATDVPALTMRQEIRHCLDPDGWELLKQSFRIKTDEEIARLPSMHDRPAALPSDEEVGKSEAMKLLGGPQTTGIDAAAGPAGAEGLLEAAAASGKGGDGGSGQQKNAGGKKQRADGSGADGGSGIEGIGKNVGFGDDVGWGI